MKIKLIFERDSVKVSRTARKNTRTNLRRITQVTMTDSPTTVFLTVVKRDNTTETFDPERITRAISKATDNSKENVDCGKVVEYVTQGFAGFEGAARVSKVSSLAVSKIHDLVEEALMKLGYTRTAKEYILYRNKRDQTRDIASTVDKIVKDLDIQPPFGPVGYITYKRTYARYIDDQQTKTEEFDDTIKRVISGCQTQLKCGFTNAEIRELYTYLMQLKFSVAGRFLWQLNTYNIERNGLMSLQNCAFTKMDNPVESFKWIFSGLLQGVGIGFSIENKYIKQLPVVISNALEIKRLDTPDADFIVPDSREGWISLFEKTLEAFFFKGESFTYSTMLVRPAGKPIRGFGGKSSGPDPLCTGITQIQEIFNKRVGQQLSSVDVLDIVCIIASVVVAGNIRRCIPKGSYVYTNCGLKPIEDIRVGDRVVSTSDTTGVATFSPVLETVCNGKREILDITSTFNTFACTPNHRMAVYSDSGRVVWKEASELVPGDLLMTSKIELETPDTVLDANLDVAKLFGALVATGKIDIEAAEVSIPVYESSMVSTLSSAIRTLGKMLDKSVRASIVKGPFNSSTTLVISETNSGCDLVSELTLHFAESFSTMLDSVCKSGLAARKAFVVGFEHNVNKFYRFFAGARISVSELSRSSIDMIRVIYNTCGIPTLFDKGRRSLLRANIPDALCFGDLVLDKVTSVLTRRHTAETYDIQVAGTENFVCNGTLTHNSALIALGDYDDIPYIKAKRWADGNVPNWRAMSNNSVVCNDTALLPEEFWDNYIGGTGEPYGLLNIDLARRVGRLADGEKYPDPTIDGMNPCFSADTLIAVADGRGAVTIKELADIGADTPVYSVNESGTVEIKMGRNPRVTGRNKKMVRVILDDGSSLTTTLDHPFRLHDLSEVHAQDLEPGMSLCRLQKNRIKMTPTDKTEYIQVRTDTQCKRKARFMEHRLIAKFNNPDKWNELYNPTKESGFFKGGIVAHHLDFNGLNNSPDNLEILTAEEHNKFHIREDQSGENNGMHGKHHSDESKKLIGELAKERYADPEYTQCVSEKMKEYWATHPEMKQRFTECTSSEQSARNIERAELTDLPTVVIDDVLYVKKGCEHCKKEFVATFGKRERAYCSRGCANSKKSSVENRTKSRNVTVANVQKERLHAQVMAYKDLEKTLSRAPMKKEWENECKTRKVPCRLRHGGYTAGNEFLLRSFAHLKEVAADYNHRVQRLEFLEETETVYNITVDSNHTVGVFTNYDNFAGDGIFVSNCGEINLSDFETCCLSECFLPNIESYAQAERVGEFMYRICKHSLLLGSKEKRTEEIVHKNMRLGLGMTGILQATPEQVSWLDPLYQHLREYDVMYSAKIGCPTSIKLTTVKPSGTLSLLPNVTPGIHPALFQFYIRRISISAGNPLVQVCRKHGYKCQYRLNFDGTRDTSTYVVEFPCKVPDGTVLAKDMTAIKQLEKVVELQRIWADNSILCDGVLLTSRIGRGQGVAAC